MIDDRFSLSEFEDSRTDKRVLRAKSDLLQDEVAQELHEVVMQLMKNIADRLNRLGHNLRPYDKPEIGVIGFRDDQHDESGYDCKLRLGCDVTISAGYADVIFSKSNPEGLYPDQIRDRTDG